MLRGCSFNWRCLVTRLTEMSERGYETGTFELLPVDVRLCSFGAVKSNTSTGYCTFLSLPITPHHSCVGQLKATEWSSVSRLFIQLRLFWSVTSLTRRKDSSPPGE